MSLHEHLRLAIVFSMLSISWQRIEHIHTLNRAHLGQNVLSNLSRKINIFRMGFSARCQSSVCVIRSFISIDFMFYEFLYVIPMKNHSWVDVLSSTNVMVHARRHSWDKYIALPKTICRINTIELHPWQPIC